MLKIARLYQICRFIDDCADELDPASSQEALRQLRRELEDPSLNSEFQKAITEINAWGVQRSDLLQLLTGAEFDQSKNLRIRTQAELFQYCDWVAGVVGKMMCPLLGCSHPRATLFAQELGRAMQLTNICRDVLEDAQKGRVYLAEEILAQFGVPEIPSHPTATPPELQKVIRFYLQLADEGYRRGYQGLPNLPFRSRICVLLAGEIYRHIGVKIRRGGCDVLRGRTSLHFFEKLWVSFKSISWLFNKIFWIAVDLNTTPLSQKNKGAV